MNGVVEEGVGRHEVLPMLFLESCYAIEIAVIIIEGIFLFDTRFCENCAHTKWKKANNKCD